MLLSNFFQERIALQASGRTDAGVHAFSQMLHFCLPKMLSFPEKFPNQDMEKQPHFRVLLGILKAVKKNCPSNIQIKKAFLVGEDFHALRSAVDKTYSYFISPQVSAFNASQIYKVTPKIFDHLKSNIPLLNQLAACLIGEKDFKSFQNTGTTVKTTVRRIFKSSWRSVASKQKPPLDPISLLGAPQEYLEFNVTGNGFLKQMVRNIVGCQLYLVEKTTDPVKALKDIMTSSKRQKIFCPAPPQGLYLQQINYPQSLDKFPLKI